MNTELNIVTAEVTMLRDTLRHVDNRNRIEFENVQRALILSQDKLLKVEFNRSSRVLDCGESVAYH